MPTSSALSSDATPAIAPRTGSSLSETSQQAAHAKLLQRRATDATAPSLRLIRRGVVTYVCALLLIAGFTITFHFITDSIVSRQDSTARVVNLSGRQRMLSQRIAMLALERAAAQPPRPDAETRRTLNQAINLLEASHQVLVHGSGADGRILPPPRAVQTVYFGPQYHLDAAIALFVAHARAVASKPTVTSADPDLQAVEQAAQEPLLTALNAAVTANQTTSEDSIAHLRKVLKCLAALMLVVLVLEALWLYRPLFKRLEAAQLRLVEIGRTDPLTGCLNRRAFTQEAQHALTNALLNDQPLAVLMVDIDHFKAINDRFGHPAGDAVINGTVASMLQTMRHGSLLCRMGGEEFAVLLCSATLDQAMHAAERIRTSIEVRPVDIGGNAHERVEATVSIGVAALTEDDTSIFQLLNRADGALYTAKRTGRNRVSSDPIGPLKPLAKPPVAHVRL